MQSTLSLRLDQSTAVRRQHMGTLLKPHEPWHTGKCSIILHACSVWVLVPYTRDTTGMFRDHGTFPTRYKRSTSKPNTNFKKKKCKKLAFKTVYQRMVKLISSNNFKNTNFHHNAVNLKKKKKKILIFSNTDLFIQYLELPFFSPNMKILSPS